MTMPAVSTPHFIVVQPHLVLSQFDHVVDGPPGTCGPHHLREWRIAWGRHQVGGDFLCSVRVTAQEQAIGDLAQRPAVWARHAHRMPSLLGKASLIDDHNSRQVVQFSDNPLVQVVTGGLGVPGVAVEGALDAVGWEYPRYSASCQPFLRTLFGEESAQVVGMSSRFPTANVLLGQLPRFAYREHCFLGHLALTRTTAAWGNHGSEPHGWVLHTGCAGLRTALDAPPGVPADAGNPPAGSWLDLPRVLPATGLAAHSGGTPGQRHAALLQP